MAFNFKLEALLKLKIQLEDSVKTKLGKAILKLESEKQLLKEFENDKTRHYDEISSISTNGVFVSKLKEYTNYSIVLIRKIESQKITINNAKKNVDKYREELIKAVHERKIMEKLKEKKREEYYKEQLKREQIINDEITSFKYNKKMTENNNT